MSSAPSNRDRLNDWEVRFGSAVIEWSFRDFQWGHTDCFHFTGACVEAVTGQNPASNYVGMYSTEIEARALLQEELGGTSPLILTQAWADRAGGEVTSSEHLIKGDIIIKERDGFIIHGIVSERGKYVTRNSKTGSFASHNLEADDIGVAF